MSIDCSRIVRGPVRPDLLRDECLFDILGATVRRCPARPALIGGGRTFTYGELDAAAGVLAGALRRRGAEARQVVGLWMPRGAEALIAQAGISRSGAAWLPFDAATPPARVRACLEDAHACGLVASRAWLPLLPSGAAPAWAFEDLQAEGAITAAPPTPAAVRPSDPAYVIYTSGSTGQPKGIAVSHRAICHFLRSENDVLGVHGEDRVYQGFSLAFDMSFEEIWIAYLAGAALWIAPGEVVGDPAAMAAAVRRERLTVLHAVPTLMGLVDDPLPTVRLINLGGETCPDTLVGRLARPGRRLFNTYGPTETTVSATVAELAPGRPVNIGRPLPNYSLLVVDEQCRPQPLGTVGELCVSGPGLAIGYVGRPDLTAERFVAHPLDAGPDDRRMYRTGDLGRIDPADGTVHCLGRADDQVKIRGFRVELGEIEAALAAQPGVAAAAVVVRTLADIEQLVAFAVSSAAGAAAAAAWRAALAARLPSYMVPAHIEVVEHLPRLTSGKVDRRALGALPLTAAPAAAGDAGVAPRNEDEAALQAALGAIFPGRALHPGDDFFDDLGGHSLLAARLVSRLRADARYAAMGVSDVYRERRLEGIAGAMARVRGRGPQGVAAARAPVPWRRRFVCGLAQAMVLPLLVMLRIASWLAPFFVYHYYTGDEDDSTPLAVLYSLTAFVLVEIVLFGVAILGKWLVVGRQRAGRFPLWGVTYYRWWLADRLGELAPVSMLTGTPWLVGYLRALGARIGRDVQIDSLDVGAPDLLTAADGVSIGTAVHLANARVDGGELVIGPVTLGPEAVVESYTVLEERTALGAGARLTGLSALASGWQVPAGETWEGAPARRVVRATEPVPPRPRVSYMQRLARMAFFAAAAIAVAVLFFMPLFPAFVLIDWMDMHLWNLYENEAHALFAFAVFFLLALPASALLVIATMLLASALRWLLPRQQAGLLPLHGWGYARKWVVSQILDSSLGVLHGVYASVFAPVWLRLMGARVGRGCEVSTATGIVPDLLSLGEQGFIADGAMLGDEEQRGGWLILRPTALGSRTFVGNGAYVADGADVPGDVLIGVQTRTPENARLAPGQTWMGSPPLLLPARERLEGFHERLTFRPSRCRRLGRAMVEAVRIVLPLSFAIASGYLVVQLVMPLTEREQGSLVVGGALALAGCAYGTASFLLVCALKWTLVGRYRPRAAPMWTPFVWLSEAVTNVYESVAVPNFLDFLRGTPMLPWALRLLGAHIGRGVYLDTTDLTEFDCVRIGDASELNAGCGPQTHLFEDRVMKIGCVEIGARVSVGAYSTILYETHIGDGVRLGPLTLVAKGERIPAGTCWEGSPAAPSSLSDAAGT